MTSRSDLSISRAVPADAAALETLLDAAATWQQERGIAQWIPGGFADDVRQTTVAGDLYVARRDDTIVGCFMLEAGAPPAIERWLTDRGRDPARGAYLARLAIARDAVGHGLGRELLECARALAAGQGFGALRLDCPAENTRLRRYYLDAAFGHLGDVRTVGPNGEHWTSSLFERATSV
jgi:GNAT superfamily N-acetyltransferase